MINSLAKQRFIVFVFTIALIISYIPKPKAFVPALGLPYLYSMVAGTAAAAGDAAILQSIIAGAGLTALIGKQLGWFDFEYGQDETSEPNHLRVATTDGTQSIPPSLAPETTQPVLTKYYWLYDDSGGEGDYCQSVSTRVTASNNQLQDHPDQEGSYTLLACDVQAETNTVQRNVLYLNTGLRVNETFHQIVDFKRQVSECPSGYYASGPYCYLSLDKQEAATAKDGAFDVGIIGGESVQYALNDPDFTSQNSTDNGSPAIINNNKMTARFQTIQDDPDTGQPQSYNVVVETEPYLLNAGYWGNSTLTNVPMELEGWGSGTAVTTRVTSQPIDKTEPATITQLDMVNGTVVNTSTQTVNGNLATVGTNYINEQGETVQVQPDQVVFVQPSSTGTQTAATVQTTTLPQTQQVNIDLPTDYARQGEAVAAADKIIEKLDEQGDTSDLQSDFSDNPLDSFFGGLNTTFTLPITTCPFNTMTVPIYGQTADFGLICDIIDPNIANIRTVFSFVFAISAMFIVLRA